MANLNTNRKKHEHQEATIRQFLETGEYETNVAILDSTTAPDIPRTVWGKLAGLCFGNHHKHYRMAMYQTWQGSRNKIMVQMGRSSPQEQYQSNETDKQYFSLVTNTRMGGFKKNCNANINRQRAKQLMTSSHVSNFRREYSQGEDKSRPESSLHFQGSHKHHLTKWKPKTGTSSAVGPRTKIDIESPKSVLVGKDLKVLINERTFGSLPLRCQHHLLTLLPHCDQMNSESKALSLGAKALNNEFFTQSCVEWSDRLAEGEFTPENRLMLKSEDKERFKMDEWKARHFEANWGDRLASPEVCHKEPQPSAACGSSVCHNSDERPSKRRKTIRIVKTSSTSLVHGAAHEAAAVPVSGKLVYSRIRLPGRPRSRFPCRIDHIFANVATGKTVADCSPNGPVVGGPPHQTETKLVTLQQSVAAIVPSISSHSPIGFKVPDLSTISSVETSEFVPSARPTSWPGVAKVRSSSSRMKSFPSELRPIVDPVVDAVHMDHPYAMQGVTRVTENMLQSGANDECLMRGVIARLTVMQPSKDGPIPRVSVAQNDPRPYQSLSERNYHRHKTGTVSALTVDNQVKTNVLSISRSSPSNKHVEFTGNQGRATDNILNGDESCSSRSVTVCNNRRVNIVRVRVNSHSESQTAGQVQSIADPPFLSDMKSHPLVRTIAVPAAQPHRYEHAIPDCGEDVLTISDLKNVKNMTSCSSVTLPSESCIARYQGSSISVTSNVPDMKPSQSASSISDDQLSIKVDDEIESPCDESQLNVSQRRKFPLQVKVYCVRRKDFTEHGNNNNLTRSLKTIVRKFALDSLNEPMCGIITSAHNSNDRTRSQDAVTPRKRASVTCSPMRINLENETETPVAAIVISDDSSECC